MNCYQLLLRLRHPRTLRIGALGSFTFPAGYYLYSGSARRNLTARLARHCRREKPLRWHIDYLTSHEDVEVIGTRTFHGTECELNQGVPGRIIAPGFGASDCRSGCGAHLKYLGRARPALAQEQKPPGQSVRG
jgi:Uri superfamily endonuclease